MDFAEQYNDVVDRAVANLRAAWARQLRELAASCEELGPTVAQHDEALASSMEFVALRARRVADRVEGPGREGQ